MQQAATVTVVQLQYGSAVELQGLPVTPRTAFGDDECDPCLLLQLLLGVATPTNDERHQLHAGRGGGHKLGGRGANASRHTEPGGPVQMLYHTETAMNGYTNWHVATHKQQGRSFGETCTSEGGDVALVMQPFLPCCRMTAAVFSGPSQGLIKHIANRFGSFPS